MPPKKAAAQASHAAMKKKQAALDISAAQEDRIREALRSLNLTEDDEAAGPAPTGAAAPHALARLNKTYLDLVRQGFQRPQVESALSALPLSDASTASALDWLLLHLDAVDLPRRYTDSSRARGPVELRHKAKEAPPQEQLQASEERRQHAAAAANLAKAAAALAAHAAAQEAEWQRQREEQEKASRRAWILQYAEESSESDVESEGGSAESTASVIEDWEVWGDPREIERRRGERRRGQLPREERLVLVAQELRQAKEGAAAAKAAGDKDWQRSCGQVIGYLKREMIELGVTEEELPTVTVAAENGPAAGGGGESASSAGISDGNGAAGNELAEESGALGEGDAEELGREGDGSSREGSEDEGLGGFDVFGDDSSQLESVTGSKRRPAAFAAAALLPWGGGGGGKKGANRGGKAAQPKAPEYQQPKALLQQLCQRKGWAAPRYERLAPSEGGVESGVGLRYSVTVDALGGRGGAPKRKGGKGPEQAAPRTFSMREGDGWARVEEAQGAAATLALLELHGQEHPELWHQLPPPYSELWLTWQEEGTGAAEEQSAEEAAAREAFIQQLLRAKQAEAAAAAAAAASTLQGAPQPASLWSEELQRRLGQGRSEEQAAAQRAEGGRMLRALRLWRGSEGGRRWQEDRGRLPVSKLRVPLVEALAEQDVVVVSGETGSGKTTQVPQFILEAMTEAGAGGECSIVCTQPRRIAAISVAERVAEERGEPAPGQRGGRVGYAVRLDSATTPHTRLLFCTTGILLRRLTGDPALGEVSHVVVDEVHERTLQGDFLIALLRDLVAHRRAAGRPLKVVLMSATLDSDLFADYFGACPVLHAEGRTFPVQQLFLEDVYEMMGYVLASDAPAALRVGLDSGTQRRLVATAGARNAATVRAGWGDDEVDHPPLNPNYDEQRYQEYSPATRRNLGRVDEDRIDFDLLEGLVGAIDEKQGEGAVLVFLPGMAEIAALHDRMVASRHFAASSHWVVPLHSSVAPAEQRRAFQRPPRGVRKVVLATNIAETSLTIEDVVYVVDAGRLKERRHDPARGMSLLVEDWVSSASARQRRGRAGRVRPGVCYALYTRHRFENCMKRYQAPEMVRVPLDELVLQIHLIRLGRRAQDFLARVLQPPPERAVEGAVRVLREVGALTLEEELTPLGHHLAQLPVDARVGKLLLLSASLGCLSPALSIAACLSYKSPFAGGLQHADAAERSRVALAAPGSRTIAAGQQSDHLVMAAAVDGWVQARRRGGAKAARDHARKHLLSEQALEMLADMRRQFAAMLADIGFAAKGGGLGGHGRGWMDDPDLPANRYASHPAVIKAVLLAALYPNIAVMDDAEVGPGRRPAWHDGVGDVAIHPSSICHPLGAARFHRPFLTYLEKVRTTKTFIRDCTVVSPAAILLFGGRLGVEHEAGRVLVDGWIRIRAAPAVAVAVKRLRRALEAVLRRKVAAPRVGVEESEGAVVAAIVELLNHEEAAQGWER